MEEPRERDASRCGADRQPVECGVQEPPPVSSG
jgi:hypothetical protein